MSVLVFTLKTQPKFTLDVSPLTPDKLGGMTNTQIKKIRLRYGKQEIPVDRVFSIKGTNPEKIRINRSSDKLTGIGHCMKSGTIEVYGHAGDYVGQYMQGGHISIQGDAGAWTGSSMSNGHIDIYGNAGDYLGAGLPGDIYGMSNGLIFVSGNAGDRVGDRMRRGLIVIHGNAGNYCGSRIAAGTIIVLNRAGKYPGYGMKRGTIILAKKPRHIIPTFRSCGNLKMQFLRLLFKQLTEMGNQFEIFRKYGPEAHRFSGDLASNGKGEILILQTIKTEI
jgi:formylmethanofuran dehydrogenase subunit C